MGTSQRPNQVATRKGPDTSERAVDSDARNLPLARETACCPTSTLAIRRRL